jgi:hypothetical protein
MTKPLITSTGGFITPNCDGISGTLVSSGPSSVVTGPAGPVFSKDVAKFNGSNFPGTGCALTTWTDLVSSPTLDGTIVNCFTGLAGTGTTVDPYNLTFDGSHNTYVQGTNNIPMNTDITMSVWVYFNSFTANFPRLIDIQDGTNDLQLVYDFSFGGWCTKNTNWESGINATGWNVTASTGVWYNAVVVWQINTTTTTFYLNGVSQSTKAGAGVGAISLANTYFLGQRADKGSGTKLDGKGAIFQIWNRALSSTEVTTNWNSTKARFGY